jgi:DNA replication initiation complex subunit (GINS family)
VNLQQLKENIAGEQDEETKRLEDSQDDESYEPKTKTRKEREEDAVLEGNDSPDIDTMIEREENQPDVNDEEQTQQIG